MASHLFQTAEKTFPQIWNFFHGHEKNPRLCLAVYKGFFSEFEENNCCGCEVQTYVFFTKECLTVLELIREEFASPVVAARDGAGYMLMFNVLQ